MNMSYLYPSQLSAPCKGCQSHKDGVVGCHSNCKKYQEYKKARAKEMTEIREGFLQHRETFHHYWS